MFLPETIPPDDGFAATAGAAWLDGDMLGRQAKPARYLVNGILETAAHGILGAQSQTFKTFLALKLAHSVCVGADFFGNSVFAAGPVLYICGEGYGALQRRVRAAQLAYGDFGGNLKIYREAVAVDCQDNMQVLHEQIRNLQPALAIFDTFSSLIRGDLNENDNAAVARVLRGVREACSVGATSSLMIHHYGKSQQNGFRGASAFLNNIDFGYAMKREGDDMLVRLSCVKMKDGEPFPEMDIAARTVALGMDNQDGTPATSLVLDTAGFGRQRKTARKKPVVGNNNVVLDALREAIVQDGVLPPKDIRLKYAGFGYGRSGRRISTRKIWREQAFKAISVDSTDGDKIYDAKLKAFSRAVSKLFENGYVVLHGDYAWPLYDD